MNVEVGIPKLVTREYDQKMISQILEGPVDEPGRWSKKPRAEKIARQLSSAEALVYKTCKKREPSVHHGPGKDLTEKVNKKIVETLINGRDRRENYNLALLKAALVAESLPEQLITPEIKSWLQSIRGKMSVLNPRHREIMSARFGLTGNPSTYLQIGQEHGISAARGRVIVSADLRKLRYKYRKLINQTI